MCANVRNADTVADRTAGYVGALDAAWFPDASADVDVAGQRADSDGAGELGLANSFGLETVSHLDLRPILCRTPLLLHGLDLFIAKGTIRGSVDHRGLRSTFESALRIRSPCAHSGRAKSSRAHRSVLGTQYSVLRFRWAREDLAHPT